MSICPSKVVAKQESRSWLERYTLVCSSRKSLMRWWAWMGTLMLWIPVGE